jgi:hypothetical protein
MVREIGSNVNVGGPQSRPALGYDDLQEIESRQYERAAAQREEDA